MGFVLGIVSILLGVLAASSFIVSKVGGEDLIRSLRPAQGWLGIVGCLWGLIALVNFLFGYVGKQPNFGFLQMARTLGASSVLACTGFLMGFSVIAGFLGSDAREKAEEVYETLAVWQVPLGIGAIVLGVMAIFA